MEEIDLKSKNWDDVNEKIIERLNDLKNHKSYIKKEIESV